MVASATTLVSYRTKLSEQLYLGSRWQRVAESGEASRQKPRLQWFESTHVPLNCTPFSSASYVAIHSPWVDVGRIPK